MYLKEGASVKMARIKNQEPRSSLKPLLLALGITKLYCFRARIHFSIVCSIVFLANPVRRSESFVAPLKNKSKQNK